MANKWISGQAFPAEIGKSYGVAFGRINYKGALGDWTARIKVAGPSRKDWIDLDTGAPLDPDLSKYVVLAFFPL